MDDLFLPSEAQTRQRQSSAISEHRCQLADQWTGSKCGMRKFISLFRQIWVQAVTAQ